MNGQAISILNIESYSNWQFVMLWIYELVTFGNRDFWSVKEEKLKNSRKYYVFDRYNDQCQKYDLVNMNKMETGKYGSETKTWSKNFRTFY